MEDANFSDAEVVVDDATAVFEPLTRRERLILGLSSTLLGAGALEEVGPAIDLTRG